MTRAASVRGHVSVISRTGINPDQQIEARRIASATPDAFRDAR
jgi:hypothetical protein